MIGRSLLALFLAFPLAEGQTHLGPAAVPPSKPTEEAQLYRNTSFGFRYRIPYGWVDRTKEMRAQEVEEPDTARAPGEKEREKSDTKKEGKSGTKEKLASAQGEVLLAVFERPPEATGETINSAVVIATESATTYHGLKKAEDYLDPLSELAAAKGFKAADEPSLTEIDGRELVRADFTKPLNDKLAMHQSTLIVLTKGQIVSFTFIAGSEDDIDNLIDGLHFGSAKSR